MCSFLAPAYLSSVRIFLGFGNHCLQPVPGVPLVVAVSTVRSPKVQLEERVTQPHNYDRKIKHAPGRNETY